MLQQDFPLRDSVKPYFFDYQFSFSLLFLECAILISSNIDSLNNANPDADQEVSITQEPRRWCGDGWTAQVLKNENDDGWAVAMIKDGEPEPALVGPWTLGRDKKNPKPLDSNAFRILVKTASEFVLRHEQQLQASLHQSIAIIAKMPGSHHDSHVIVKLDVEPAEEEPSAILTAIDEAGQLLAQMRVPPNYKLTRTRAEAWVEGGFGLIGTSE